MNNREIERLRLRAKLYPGDRFSLEQLSRNELRSGNRNDLIRSLLSSDHSDLVYEYFNSPEAVLELKEIIKTLDGRERLRLQLILDYISQIEIFEFYEVLAPGKTSYTSDYAETEGEEYEMPTMQEIFSYLKPYQIKIYEEMEKDGLEPKLQLTPIGLNIRTLASKIDGHKTMPSQLDTFISARIINKNLKYAPTGYDARNQNKLKTLGGVSKAQYIKANKGWLIDIVATKKDLQPDPYIQTDDSGTEYTNAQKTEIYFKNLKEKGMQGLCYESDIVAQMRALKEGEPLEKDFLTILPDSSIDNEDFVSCAVWNYVQVSLIINSADFRIVILCCRSSVRVPRDL